MLENVGVQVIKRTWWMLVVRGVLAIIFGLIALLAPGIALLAFVYVFAAYALLDCGHRGLCLSWPHRAGVALHRGHLGSRDWHYGDRCGFHDAGVCSPRVGPGHRWCRLHPLWHFSVHLSRCWLIIDPVVGWHLWHRLRHPLHRARFPTAVVGIIVHRLDEETSELAHM